MAKGYTIRTKGLDKVLKALDKEVKTVEETVDKIFGEEVLEMESRMVQDAPVDESFLKQQIKAERKDIMYYEASAQAFYAPYVEFGTKRYFQNPYPGIDSAQYKGPGKGGGKGFYNEILAWVDRKGFASTYGVKSRKQQRYKTTSKAAKENIEAAAYAIYLHILRFGVKPQPFFFKNYFIAIDQILKRLKTLNA